MNPFSHRRLPRFEAVPPELGLASLSVTAVMTSALLSLTLGLALASPVGAADEVKVLVPAQRSDLLQQLEASGARRVADRGSYVVVAAPEGSLPSDASLAARADFDRVRLRRRALSGPSNAIRRRSLQVVQFEAPPTDDELSWLTDNGARIVDYLPQNGFLVWIPDSERPRFERAQGRAAGSSVRFRHDYERSDAIDPRLDAASLQRAAVEVTAQLVNGDQGAADLDRLVQLAEAVTAPAEESVGGKFINVRVLIRGDRLAAAANLPSVVNLEPFVAFEPQDERQAQIVAGNLSPTQQGPSAPAYLSWLASLGFSTTPSDYPVIAVVDDGIDNGGTEPLNSEFRSNGSSGGASRITFAVTPPGSNTSNTAGVDGHGTINASILAGFHDVAGINAEDSFGFNYGLGISPFGRIANVRVFNPEFNLGTGTVSMVSDYYSRGARISSNSWGAGTRGVYDSFAQAYDSLARDARATVGGNQQLMLVFSAGNAGPSSNTVGSPATAKNVLSVGASESPNPATSAGSGCQSYSAADGDDARDLAFFSSRGPCDDNRVKPDVVAPGSFIHGAAPKPEFSGVRVCGPAGNDFSAPGGDALYPAGSEYTISSGTSHATPAVAGYLSLIHEFVARNYGLSAPSPALQKAYVIHSARHLGGHNAGGNLPTNGQGFGRVDMGLGFRTEAPRFLYDQQTVLSSPGSSLSFAGQIIDASEPVRLVLAWTDAPGSTTGNAYVNDLNLILTAGGTSYRGNNFLLGESQANGTADTRNNVEAIFLSAGLQGSAVIDVNATTIAGDGVPGNGDSTDQDFALVAYNFAPITSTGTITFHRGAYSCSDSIRVSVGDSDLTGAGSLAVPLTTSTGDDETVIATESPANSGLFAATLPSQAGSPADGNGKLDVVDGVTITGSYNDANHGLTQATATIDCIAPNVDAVAVESVGGAQATITLSTDEPSWVLVRYGTACGALSEAQSAVTSGSDHAVVLSGLRSQTRYYFSVQATDDAGNVATFNNEGACYELTTTGTTDGFTELFENGFDLAHRTLQFVPDGSDDFYRACSSPATQLPVDPAGGTAIPLEDDGFRQINLTGAQVFLYGQAYSSIFVGSNGYLAFGSGDSEVVEEYAKHFAHPRISALFDDLDPDGAAGVSWKQLSDRVAITYLAIPEFGLGGSNTFQIELFFDGVIRITYLDMSVEDGLVGLSAGTGVPPEFVASDLSAYVACPDSEGSITLDQQLYSCRDTIDVQVHDGDLKGSGTLTVDVAVEGGDAEGLTLAEDPNQPGTFSAILAARDGTVSSGNGWLELDGGQTLIASYLDADDGTGSTVVRTASAVSTCLDSFTLYRSMRTTGTDRFAKFGPIDLADTFFATQYAVSGVDKIGIPAEQNQRAILDPTTRYREYRVRLADDAAAPPEVEDMHVRNACNDLHLSLKKPDTILLPAALSASGPVAAPASSAHDLDHLLCYRSRVLSKSASGAFYADMPKGMQVTLRDELEPAVTRRYDLLHVSRVCLPVAKSGTPVYMTGPSSGAPKVIAPASVKDPNELLVCYKAALARKLIVQSGCVAANPSDRGTAIEPPQSKHTKLDGLHLSDQFGPGQVDTAKEREVCIPSVLLP